DGEEGVRVESLAQRLDRLAHRTRVRGEIEQRQVGIARVELEQLAHGGPVARRERLRLPWLRGLSQGGAHKNGPGNAGDRAGDEEPAAAERHGRMLARAPPKGCYAPARSPGAVHWMSRRSRTKIE